MIAKFAECGSCKSLLVLAGKAPCGSCIPMLDSFMPSAFVLHMPEAADKHEGTPHET